MQIIQTNIVEEGGSTPAFRVEFSGNGGEVISVRLRRTDGSDLTRDNVVGKAREILQLMGTAEDGSTTPSAH